MGRLFEIIAEYRSELTLLPTMILIWVLVTVLCYIVFNAFRWVKYVPALAGIALGAFNLISAIPIFTTPAGLDKVWSGVVYFVAGCIALGTAWIIAMLSSSERKNAKTKKKERQQLLEEQELEEQAWRQQQDLEQQEQLQTERELARAVQETQAKLASVEAPTPEIEKPSESPDATSAKSSEAVEVIKEELPKDATRVFRVDDPALDALETYEEPVKIYVPNKTAKADPKADKAKKTEPKDVKVTKPEPKDVKVTKAEPKEVKVTKAEPKLREQGTAVKELHADRGVKELGKVEIPELRDRK